MEKIHKHLSSFYITKIKDDDAVEGVLRYGRYNNKISNGKKIQTKKVIYYDGMGVNIERLDKAAKNFKYIRRLYGKDKGVLAYHITISFKYAYATYQVDKWMKDFCSLFFENYQYVYGIHEKENKPHVHIVVNSVSFKTGKKFQVPFPFKGKKYNAWYEMLQEELDLLIYNQ